MSPSSILSTLNLLPPHKLICDFNYWSSLFSEDMSILWEKGHGIPLNKLPPKLSDMIFPYLLLALADYKTLNKKKLSGVGIDNLIKGAAGQAVQCFNLSAGLKEEISLNL